ncbi:hypothetical protein ACFL14_02975 [Patescibacteria group bacterium]
MNKNQQETIDKLKQTLTEDEMDLVHRVLVEKSVVRKTLEKHPVLLAVLGTLGVVSVFYGFEKIIDQTLLSSSPIYLLLFGFLILYFTGLLLKKL